LPDDIRNRRFERIVLPHLDAAYNLARWLLHSGQDAEDVVQEAMMRAFRSLDGCREATARPWVLRIVRNAAWDWLKTNADARTTGFADLNPDDGDGAAFVDDAFTSPAVDPECAMLAESDRLLLDEMIAALPPGFREVVVLRELEELSYKEIAEIAGIPIGTVMSRLARARGLLQKAWRDRHG